MLVIYTSQGLVVLFLQVFKRRHLDPLKMLLRRKLVSINPTSIAACKCCSLLAKEVKIYKDAYVYTHHAVLLCCIDIGNAAMAICTTSECISK